MLHQDGHNLIKCFKKYFIYYLLKPYLQVSEKDTLTRGRLINQVEVYDSM
jgi:hypothetical protein